MSYELCAYLTSLFKSPGLLHRADKSKLVDAIVDYVKNNADLENYCDEETDVFVLDGGSLLHKVHWENNSTYFDISNSYLKYVKAKYGNTIVVFDGYHEGLSTKDNTHIRRTSKTHSKFHQ